MKLLIASVMVLGLLSVGHAEETLGEKGKAEAKSAARTAKKSWNRTKEAVCGELTGDSKSECLAKEAKHRLEEGKDAIVDKVDEVKESIDSDKK